MITVVATGGFDPIHSGHINYLKEAALSGTRLVVGVNSDEWLSRKKGRSFMPWEERAAIVRELACVDDVISFDDSDNSAIHALEQVKLYYPNDRIVFVNGGDRTSDNIPEMSVEGVEFEFGIGGNNKANSSSWILKEWKYPTERRVWGEFSNLFEDGVVKVKELVIEPGKAISYQRHFKRSEIWFVSKGECEIKYGADTELPDHYSYHVLKTDQSFTVRAKSWHQIVNKGKVPCHIVEIQYGEET